MRQGRARPPSLPETLAERRILAAEDGVELSLYRWREAPEAAPLLLWGHANGFPAGGYAPLLRLLAAHFRVFAYDARGHGGSGLPDAPFETAFTFDRYARDLALALAAVEAEAPGAPLYYASHSFCGVAGLRLAGLFGREPWRAFTAFEPPVSPPSDHPARAFAVEASLELSGMARRRRPRWADPETFRRSLVGRAAYAGFDADALAAHCEGSLHPTGEGDWRLASPGELEAHNYEAALDPSTFEGLARIARPVTFVACAGGGGGGNPSWAASVQADAAERTPEGRLERFDGAGHLVPFEDPARCAALVRRMLE